MRNSLSGRSGRTRQRRIVDFIVSLVLLVVVAVFGRDRLGGSSPSPSDPVPAKVSGAGRPIDGDSLFVGRDEVRLKDIDAPEGRQFCQRDGRDWPCGEEARRTLQRLIGRDVVECRVFERDRFARLLSQCSAGSRDLNAGMVQNGFALAYGGYNREEEAARAAKRGLWSGQFERPRDWRDTHIR